jgi:hypothetical protein
MMIGHITARAIASEYERMVIRFTFLQLLFVPHVMMASITRALLRRIISLGFALSVVLHREHLHFCSVFTPLLKWCFQG